VAAALLDWVARAPLSPSAANAAATVLRCTHRAISDADRLRAASAMLMRLLQDAASLAPPSDTEADRDTAGAHGRAAQACVADLVTELVATVTPDSVADVAVEEPEVLSAFVAALQPQHVLQGGEPPEVQGSVAARLRADVLTRVRCGLPLTAGRSPPSSHPSGAPVPVQCMPILGDGRSQKLSSDACPPWRGTG
jgi:hypothetical protein